MEDWTGDVLVFERYLFPVTDQDLNALLREIVKADHGGFNYLSSSVLFLSSQDNIIYHCYDNRGVDIAVLADDKRLELFTDCHDLLLDYDMEEMERRVRGRKPLLKVIYHLLDKSTSQVNTGSKKIHSKTCGKYGRIEQ